MKYAITISEMDEHEFAQLTAYLKREGATLTQAVAGVVHTMKNPPQVFDQPTPPVGPAPGVMLTGQPTDPFAAPASPPPPPPAGATAPDRDSRGIPHNPQFHADSKRTNANGSWARRKNVDKAACEAWEATFTGAAPGNPSIPTPPAAPVGAPPVPQTAPTMQQPAGPPVMAPQPTTAEINAKFAPGLPPQGVTVPAPGGDPFAAPAPAPVAPPAPPAPVVEQLPDVPYATWHAMYTNLATAGRLTVDKYTEICERYGAIEDQMKFYKDADARARSYQEFEALAAL